MKQSTELPHPKRRITVTDAVLIIVGIVVGAGIFRAPSLVAANTSNDTMFFLAWILGGIVSIAGALCYAELTTAFTNTGGDYHFLNRAYGKRLAFLFAWARISVIQTGSIALLSYIFGDYFSQVYSLGEHSSFIYAAMVIIVLTALNMTGIRFGTGTQRLFTLSEIGGVLLIVTFGLLYSGPTVPIVEPAQAGSAGSSLGLAMIFVLLTYGGWNEAAYISAELKSGSNGMIRTLIISISIITVLYLLINVAYIKVLGHGGLGRSAAAGADLMRLTAGSTGTYIIGTLVAISALTSANATIFTGARTNYALGKDFKIFSFLGKWNERASGPVNAFLIQGLVSLALISFGLFTRSGFETIIEYTAPVFWFFFLLVGIALFVLRKKEPEIYRPFRVPLYPITPIIFCLSSAYLLYSSVTYTGFGALAGIYVLLAGVIILLIFRKLDRHVTIENPAKVSADTV